MTTCIACGMPMNEASEFAMNDTSKNYCIHCARSDGTMQSFKEKRDSFAKFLIKTQGLDPGAALHATEGIMKKLPAWTTYFS